jgi:hypothetical protein
MAAGTQYASRFSVRADFVGEEHHAELAEDKVETFVGERQIVCIRGLEDDAFGTDALRRELEDRWVDVGGDDLRLRHRLTHCPGDNAGAGGGLKNALRLEERRALGDELRIGLEQQRAHVAVVKRGHRMLEGAVCLSHPNGPLRLGFLA